MGEIPEKHVGRAGSSRERRSETAGMPDQIGNVARCTMEELAEEIVASFGKSKKSLGPLEKVYVFWIAGMSCDGCTVSVSGATEPALEDLLTGSIPGLPLVVLHHYVLQLEAGDHYVRSMEKAEQGLLDGPYVIVYEGSVPDENLTVDCSPFSGEGSFPLWAPSEERRRIPTAEWLKRLSPGAAATIAIGTCATWGGIPAAYGNTTGSMSVMDFLGKDYRSALGLPVINIPGCAPVGDNFTDAVQAILLFLQGLGPLPEFDELGRPAWQFSETVHRHCVRAGYYEEGTFATEYGGKECLVEIGCWGPVVNCNITERGAISHMGGCMNAGGPCIGCTMPGFPDKFSPFYKTPPGSLFSTYNSRILGSFVRALRRISQRERNREIRWRDEVPSGWAAAQGDMTLTHKILEFFYEKWQFWGANRPGRQLPEEQFPGGYRILPEQKYGKDYQVLPEERAKKLEKRD
ncbi:MAG TPA: hydrogenase expression protein HypE [Blastocatellia bacterium]|nr:hydrogenase expression protein HypE [Blastocatellia bacterium]